MDNEAYAYCVFVPPDYTPERAWPVILFLHGSGERGEDGFLQTDIGLGRALRRNWRQVPAIVIMPQCRPNQTWVGPMVRMALRCIEETSHEYRLDPHRLVVRRFVIPRRIPARRDGGGRSFRSSRRPNCAQPFFWLFFSSPRQATTRWREPRAVRRDSTSAQ